MIKITKEEAELIRRVDPTVFIAVTGRHKNARSKRRYVSEDIDVMRLLKHNAEAAAIVDAESGSWLTDATMRRTTTTL